jgi:hypothetical protein
MCGTQFYCSWSLFLPTSLAVEQPTSHLVDQSEEDVHRLPVIVIGQQRSTLVDVVRLVIPRRPISYLGQFGSRSAPDLEQVTQIGLWVGQESLPVAHHLEVLPVLPLDSVLAEFQDGGAGECRQHGRVGGHDDL